MEDKHNRLAGRTIPQTPANLELSRRKLLKTGLLGGAFLTVASSTATLSGCASQPPQISASASSQAGLVFLRPEDVSLYRAIIPAVIGPVFPTDPAERERVLLSTLKRIDTLMLRMGTHNQKELRKLFDLLDMRVTRFITTGIWKQWQDVTVEEADAFLASWETSSLSLYRSAYNALCDTVLFPFYSGPDSSQITGYSGPPQYVLSGLPQFQTGQASQQGGAS